MELVGSLTKYKAQREAKAQARALEPYMNIISRVGLTARAIVYGLMGVFAMMLITGHPEGKTEGTKGTMEHLTALPWGKPALFVLGIGLFAYAVFRLLLGIRDYDNKGSRLVSLGLRAGYIFGGAFHIYLAIFAIWTVFSPQPPEGYIGLAHSILILPLGQVWLFAVGAGIASFGIGQIVIAVRDSFAEVMRLPKKNEALLKWVCRFGISARGVVFTLMGYLFCLSAVHSNSHEAKGIKGAWDILGLPAFGLHLQLIIAFGLVAYMFFGFTEARYRHYTG